jgi:hypothetical protein
MAVYGPVRHPKNIRDPYNICLVTDRSIYCHSQYYSKIYKPPRVVYRLTQTFNLLTVETLFRMNIKKW